MLKIDLGAGNLCSNKIDRYKRYLGNNYNPSDYIGVDIRQNSGVDKVCDFETEKLPFTDNSVDEIVTIHTLEHIHIVCNASMTEFVSRFVVVPTCPCPFIFWENR